MSSQLWPMQFSDKVTLLTWECMQNNALSESVATQVAKKVLPQSLCTSSSLWYLSVASSSVYIKQSLVSICCLKLCVHQAVSGIYLMPQALCTSSSLWYLSDASSSVYIKQSLVSICCLKLCVHQAVSGIYLLPQALCTSSSLWYLSVGHLVARPTKLYCHVTQTTPNPKPSHRRSGNLVVQACLIA